MRVGRLRERVVVRGLDRLDQRVGCVPGVGLAVFVCLPISSVELVETR